MNKTDENIHETLMKNEYNYTIDSEVENNIMNEINNQKDYTTILSKIRSKTKIGLLLSLILLTLYGVTTYFELLSSNYNQPTLKVFYPSIFTGIAVTIVYFEIIIGISLLKNKSDYKSSKIQ